MKFLLGLAWKNLSRYRRRTIITALAIAVGLAVYIFMDSLLVGMERESERNLIWYETGSARVMNSDYWADRDTLPLDEVIENPAPVLARLNSMGVDATPRTVFKGEVIVFRDPYPEDGSLPARLYGVDPATDGSVFRISDTVSQGRYLKPGENGVLLGSGVADTLGAQVGYPLVIETRTREGYKQTMDMEVVGIVDSPNPVVNRTGVFLPLDTANLYLQMGGAVTEIDLHFPEVVGAPARAAEVQAALTPQFPGLMVADWKALAADYVALAETKSSASGIILFLVFVIAAVGVSNTMLMAVYERFRELGMMRAMGMKDRSIRRLFLMEAAGIGLIGSLVGVALGVALAAYMVNVGIDVRSLIGNMDVGYRTAGIMRGAWHPEAIVRAFLVGIVLAVAVAFVPTRRALGMSIPDALRHQ